MSRSRAPSWRVSVPTLFLATAFGLVLAHGPTIWAGGNLDGADDFAGGNVTAPAGHGPVVGIVRRDLGSSDPTFAACQNAFPGQGTLVVEVHARISSSQGDAAIKEIYCFNEGELRALEAQPELLLGGRFEEFMLGVDTNQVDPASGRRRAWQFHSFGGSGVKLLWDDNEADPADTENADGLLASETVVGFVIQDAGFKLVTEPK